MKEATTIGAALVALFALSLLALVGLAANSPLQPRNAFLSLENAHLGVWRIYNVRAMKGAPREYFVGTAFAVMPNHFITNAHVLTTPHRYGVPLAGIRLDQSGGSFIHIERLLYVSIVLDLALFSTKETVKGHLKLAERRPSWAGFTQLSSIGYPKGDFQRMKQRGRVTYEDPFGDSIGIGFDRDDLSGASGAPILDTKGAVVAVLYNPSKMSPWALE